eukprot:7386211-Prymnesium_polylepis.2
MEVMGAAAGRKVQVMAVVTGVMWVEALLVVRMAEAAADMVRLGGAAGRVVAVRVWEEAQKGVEMTVLWVVTRVMVGALWGTVEARMAAEVVGLVVKARVAVVTAEVAEERAEVAEERAKAAV